MMSVQPALNLLFVEVLQALRKKKHPELAFSVCSVTVVQS